MKDIYCTGIEMVYHATQVGNENTEVVISNIHVKKRYRPIPIFMIHTKGIFIETDFGLGGITTNVSCISRERILRLRVSPGKHKNCYTLREILMEYAPLEERPRKEVHPR